MYIYIRDTHKHQDYLYLTSKWNKQVRQNYQMQICIRTGRNNFELTDAK